MSAQNAIRVTLNSYDAHVIIKALDLFMRIHMGQLGEIKHTLIMQILTQSQQPSLTENVDAIDAHIKGLQAIFFPKFAGSPGASYGIRETPNQDARRAYDIFQELRYYDSKVRLPGGVKEHGPLNIFDKPCYITDGPHPTVEVVGLLERIAAAANVAAAEDTPVITATQTPTTLKIVQVTGAGTEEKENNRYGWRAYQAFTWPTDQDAADPSLHPAAHGIGAPLFIERLLPHGKTFRVSRSAGEGEANAALADSLDTGALRGCKSWDAVSQALLGFYDCQILRDSSGVSSKQTQARIVRRK